MTHDSHDHTHHRDTAQADFVGVLAMVLIGIAVLFGVTMVAIGLSAG